MRLQPVANMNTVSNASRLEDLYVRVLIRSTTLCAQCVLTAVTVNVT